jgi:hypothetical protein
LSARKYLLEPIDVLPRLRLVLFERPLQFGRLSRLRHLGQGTEDLLFRELDIFEGLVKQLTKIFAGHDFLHVGEMDFNATRSCLFHIRLGVISLCGPSESRGGSEKFA